MWGAFAPAPAQKTYLPAKEKTVFKNFQLLLKNI
jgi:hypothetical protein